MSELRVTTMAAEVNWEDDDEWELINDDGFVYKRKRRRLDTTSISDQPPVNSAAEDKKNHLEWKRRALLKLKESYQREIRQWEHLSNTLNLMKQKTPRQISDLSQSTDQFTAPPVSLPESALSNSRKVLDQLLSQTEAQEAIIRDVSNLCDVAEALCSSREDTFNKMLADLPVWTLSPSELMTALCDSA